MGVVINVSTSRGPGVASHTRGWEETGMALLEPSEGTLPHDN